MASANKAAATCATKFTLAVYKEVIQSAVDGNVFMSPSSILVVMAMLHAGAKNKTLEQMTQALHFDSKTDKEVIEMMSGFMSVLKQDSGSVTLKSANRLYPHTDKTILEDYITTITKHYQADVKPMNYTIAFEAARNEINKWVEDETSQKIKQLLPAGSLNSLTVMVVVNAIYFKGNWATQFDAAKTNRAKFHTPSGTVMVDMMRKEIKKVRFSESKSLKCQVLQLPYVGDEVSMMIVLPNDKDGLPQLEKELTLDKLSELQSNHDSMKVDISLPKFKLESSFEMKDVLRRLGMPDAFDVNKADFSRMGKDLFISQVFHKAFVDVNEEGTEAAAATAAVMMKRSMPAPPQRFVADHPFMFFIWDLRLNAPLFVGRLVKPEGPAGKEEL